MFDKKEVMKNIQYLSITNTAIYNVVNSLLYKYKFDLRIIGSEYFDPELNQEMVFLMETCYDELVMSIISILVELNECQYKMLVEAESTRKVCYVVTKGAEPICLKSEE